MARKKPTQPAPAPTQEPLPEIPQDLMRPGDAAKLLGINVGTLYRWMETGKLPYYRMAGYERRVSRRDAVGMVQREQAPAKTKRVERTSAHERDQAAKRTMESLKRHGLDKYL
jgi:excisionase family DNA binding protein